MREVSMKRMTAAAAVLLMAIVAANAGAQIGAMVRGTVTDEKGQPIPDVKVEIKFEGTRDQKARTFTQTTNKKGYFTRVGLPDGAYKLTFTKDGFDPTSVNTNISLGGLSDLGTIPLRAAKVAPAAAADTAGALPASAAAGPADAAALAKEHERFKQSFMQAIEAGRAGRLDEAEALYKEILTKAPDLAVAHYNLGFVYRQKQDWTAAEAEYRKVIELQPDSSDGYIALAGISQSRGQSDEAIKTLADAASRFPQDAKVQYALAVLYFDAGKPTDAVAAFKKLRELDPSNPEPLYFLGVLALQNNEAQQAIGYLEQYVGASGQNQHNLTTAQGLLKALKK